MYCNYCGMKLPDDVKFCYRCGAPIATSANPGDAVPFGYAAVDQTPGEAEEQARWASEEQASRAAEEQARWQAEEQARRAAEEQARREAEEQARREAEEQARRQAEEQARWAAEEQARREAEMQAKLEAEAYAQNPPTIFVGQPTPEYEDPALQVQAGQQPQYDPYGQQLTAPYPQQAGYDPYGQAPQPGWDTQPVAPPVNPGREKKPKKKKKGGLIALLIFLLLAAGAAAAYFLIDGVREQVDSFVGGIFGKAETETEKYTENPFKDVSADDVYYDAVMWAINAKPQVAGGTDEETFSPDAVCSRARAILWLWNANGSPEPEIKENPFTDVQTDDAYYKAVLWAYGNKYLKGVNDNTFGVSDSCTKAMALSIIWKSLGKPASTYTQNPFTDAEEGAYYYQPACWALEKGVITVGSDGKLDSDALCTRSMLVYYLYKAFGK